MKTFHVRKTLNYYEEKLLIFYLNFIDYKNAWVPIKIQFSLKFKSRYNQI